MTTPKFLSVTELTERNEKLQKAAAAAIDKADKLVEQYERDAAAIREKYASETWRNVPRAQRQQNIKIELADVAKGLKVKLAETKSDLQAIQSLSDDINGNADLYQNPIKRLSWMTVMDEKLRQRRNEYAQTLRDMSVHELSTHLRVFQGSSDLAGLAALSSEVGRRNDKTLSRELPNARIVDGLRFGDEAHLDAIFKAGRHMVDVVVENERRATALLSGRRPNATDRVRSGLRVIEPVAPEPEGGAA